MKIVSKVVRWLLAIIKTFRLALPKLGVGWMFALLTINFNRISIVELNVTAVAITAMLAMHYFLSPFQVISGRIADQNPVLGLRRTPYLLLASVFASLAFLGLPSAAHAMGAGNALGYLGGFALLAVFGVCIAVMGDSHHSLIAETIEPQYRGGVISVVWTFTILSTIIAAVVMNIVMPEYSPEAMQRLYNLTPFIVIISTFVGVIGIEKRLAGEQLEAAIEASNQAAPSGNPIASALKVLRENSEAAAFFGFIFISILAIFLQDNILEPFGAEVFGMGVAETTSFQPTWGGGVLLGMIFIGIISVIFKIKKRTIALVGCAGTGLGYALLAYAAMSQQEALITPSLTVMGLFTGFFNVGALSLMMDMTVEGATGLYMGLWGMAQAFGMGTASFGGGLLHTGLIGTGALTPATAYGVIFGMEAAGMALAAGILWTLSVKRFRSMTESHLSTSDAVLAMQVDS